MEQIYKAVVIVGTTVILVSFLFAFLNRNNNKIPIYLKLFYIYVLLILLLSINTIILQFTSFHYFKTAVLIERMINITDIFFWTYFFYIYNGSKSKLANFFIVPAFFITIVTILIISFHEELRFVIIGISNFTKCLFCLTYFYNLFKTAPSVILNRDPLFWVITGLFFYTAVTIPIYVTTAYLEMVGRKELLILLFNITNIAIIIMHLFFIKGQLCIRLHHKT